MSDELPEWPTSGTTANDKGITQRIDEFLQVALNENDIGLGPQVVGKWMVIAEVSSADARTLRLIDSDLMPWEVRGMLAHVSDWHRGDTYTVFGDDDEDGDSGDASHA